MDMALRATPNVLRLGNLLRMGVFWSVALIFSYLKSFFERVWFRSSSHVSFPRSPPLGGAADSRHGKACIVTGASSGIGKATAEALALHGFHVILAGRSLTRLVDVLSELRAKHKGISVEVQELDVTSPESILKFKDQVRKSLEGNGAAEQRDLCVLVNNAGILACSQRWTKDGYDTMMASNYLGPYFLTQQLTPLLRNAGSHSRIVNVVSFTHRCVRRLTVSGKRLAQGSMQSSSWKGDWYRLAQIYETSKFCKVMFTYELHRRLSVNKDSAKISVLAADPGLVQTNILREVPPWLEWLAFLVLKTLGLLQSPEAGAKAVVDAALAPEGLSGQYFFGGNGRVLKSSPLSYDLDLAKQLWEASHVLCNTFASAIKRRQ